MRPSDELKDSADTGNDVTSPPVPPDAPPAAVVVNVPVDNIPDVPPDAVVDEPLQEMPEDELPREIVPGAMGEERIRLMQLIGLDVNHPFDEEAEEQIRRRDPSYDGVVTKAIWRVLIQENPVK